jgi:hypothetical protein
LAALNAVEVQLFAGGGLQCTTSDVVYCSSSTLQRVQGFVGKMRGRLACWRIANNVSRSAEAHHQLQMKEISHP